MTEPILIPDNVECIKILTELGLVDKLQPEPGFNSCTTFFDYQDCYCMAAYHKGHPDENDNGFMISMIPHAMMAPEDARELFEEVRALCRTEEKQTRRIVSLDKRQS